MTGGWRHWSGYMARYRGHGPRVGGVVVAALVQSVLVAPFVWLVRELFDRVLPRGQVSELALYGAGLLAVQWSGGALAVWVRKQTLTITKEVITGLRLELLERIYDLPRAFHSGVEQGRLHASLVQETERLDVMSNALVAQLLPAAMGGLVLGLALAAIEWRLALAMACAAPFLVAVNRAMKPRLEERFRKFRQSFEGFSQGMLFVLGHVDLSRMQSAVELEKEKQTRNLEKLKEASTRLAWLDTGYGQAQTAIATTASVLVLLGGGWLVARGQMTLGALLSFYVTAGLLHQHLRTVLTAVPQVLAAGESMKALAALLDETSREPYQGSERGPVPESYRLESVTFGYQPERALLKDVNMRLERGRTVALLGPNGCGKSTLAYLLAGFYRPLEGRLLAGELPYDQAEIAWLRSSMAVVWQDPQLFHGTIRENITYGRPEAHQMEIEAAARRATAHEFIASLPLGYDTVVGEQGVLLSGGQRQKIAITRALLRNPRLLILDEPTNHLDGRAIEQLMKELEERKADRATVIISHDPDVARHADESWVLDDGRLTRWERLAQ